MKAFGLEEKCIFGFNNNNNNNKNKNNNNNIYIYIYIYIYINKCGGKVYLGIKCSMLW